MLALSLSITYSRALSHNTGETRPRAGIEAITSVETLRVALSLPLSRLCPIGRLTSFSRIDQIPINLSLVVIVVCQSLLMLTSCIPIGKHIVTLLISSLSLGLADQQIIDI